MVKYINTIIDDLIKYDKAYALGNPIIPDSHYDTLYHNALIKFPDHLYFTSSGSDDTSMNKVKLPYKMGSLNQIYEHEFDKWFMKYKSEQINDAITISDKLDGISAMLMFDNGKLHIGYTRGNGVEGQNITRHLCHVLSIPMRCDTAHNFVCRGELIMRDEIFKEKYASDYSTSRSLVAGLFNKKIPNKEMLKDVDFIAYQMVTCDDDRMDAWEDNILFLNSLEFNTVHYVIIDGDLINDELLTLYLTKRKEISQYELDGIVLSFNKFKEVESKSNSSSINPEYAVKYKVVNKDEIAIATVKRVNWKVSKNGYLKPRVEISPVKLYGTKVTFTTGFNAKFILDNNIGPGSNIKITKSGSVIPHILEVITPTTADVPDTSIIGNYSLNNSGIEFVLDDLADTTIKFEQLLSFFTSLKIDKFKRASLGKILLNMNICDASYELIINIFFKMTKNNWIDELGINGGKIYESLHNRLNNMTLSDLLGSLKYMGVGFGKRKAKLLIDQLNNDIDFWELTCDDIINLNGFDIVTATKIVNGIAQSKKFYDDNSKYMTFAKEIKSDNLSSINVVFTGFRDKELEVMLELNGAKVSNGVSKNTTHIVCNDVSVNSGKIQKGEKLGIIIMDVETFKNEIGVDV